MPKDIATQIGIWPWLRDYRLAVWQPDTKGGTVSLFVSRL